MCEERIVVGYDVDSGRESLLTPARSSTTRNAGKDRRLPARWYEVGASVLGMLPKVTAIRETLSRTGAPSYAASSSDAHV